MTMKLNSLKELRDIAQEFDVTIYRKPANVRDYQTGVLGRAWEYHTIDSSKLDWNDLRSFEVYYICMDDCLLSTVRKLNKFMQNH